MSTLLSSKQPSEAYYVGFDFTEYLGEAATVDSAVVVAAEQIAGTDRTATVTDVAVQTITSPIVYVWVRAGTSGINYVITCTATDSDGQVHQLEGILPVRELPALSPLEPVSLTEAKMHLRLATTEADAAAYTTEDNDLIRMIIAAREQAEAETWRTLIYQTKTHYLQAWPSKRFIELPGPPLQSVTGVYYTLDGESEATFDSGDYSVDTVSEPGRIVLNVDESWPTGTLAASNPIRITYTAGYTIPDDVPAAIKSAILLILGDLYEHRGEVVIGAPVDRIRDAIDNLLSTKTVRRFI